MSFWSLFKERKRERRFRKMSKRNQWDWRLQKHHRAEWNQGVGHPYLDTRIRACDGLTWTPQPSCHPLQTLSFFTSRMAVNNHHLLPFLEGTHSYIPSVLQSVLICFLYKEVPEGRSSSYPSSFPPHEQKWDNSQVLGLYCCEYWSKIFFFSLPWCIIFLWMINNDFTSALAVCRNKESPLMAF